jgi:MFS family permease
VWSYPEFRGLFTAQVLSLLGDQLARVALAVLVYSRTGSALLTALVYALGFLPAVVAGPLLSPLADRRPRRELMVACDLLRAGLVLAMALGAAHLVLLCVLLVATEVLSAPFNAARAALLPDVLTGEPYLVASALGNITAQVAQVGGFAFGGAVVALTGPRPALAVDAATYLASAAVLRLTVARRRPPVSAASMRTTAAGPRAVAELLARDRHLRVLVLLALLCGWYAVPEALAAPYAAQLGGGSGSVGLLMAAQPLGAALGAVGLTRLPGAAARLRWTVPLSVLAMAALVACGVPTGLSAVLALLVVSGVGTSYQLAANAAFAVAVPDEVRGQAFGLVQAAIVAVQGVGFLLAGALAERFAPSTVVAGAGALGLVCALAVAAAHREDLVRSA